MAAVGSGVGQRGGQELPASADRPGHVKAARQPGADRRGQSVAATVGMEAVDARDAHGGTLDRATPTRQQVDRFLTGQVAALDQHPPRAQGVQRAGGSVHVRPCPDRGAGRHPHRIQVRGHQRGSREQP
jgi:hypothetical protein